MAYRSIHMVSYIMSYFIYFSYQVLPVQVREQLPSSVEPEDYDKTKMVIDVRTTNAHPIQPFYRVFCNHCETTHLPSVIRAYEEKYNIKNVVDLINCWDQAQVNM